MSLVSLRKFQKPSIDLFGLDIIDFLNHPWTDLLHGPSWMLAFNSPVFRFCKIILLNDRLEIFSEKIWLFFYFPTHLATTACNYLALNMSTINMPNECIWQHIIVSFNFLNNCKINQNQTNQNEKSINHYLKRIKEKN